MVTARIECYEDINLMLTTSAIFNGKTSEINEIIKDKAKPGAKPIADTKTDAEKNIYLKKEDLSKDGKKDTST